MVRTRELKRMGRRRFVNAIANLGVSSYTVSHLSKDALAAATNNPEKEVPRLLGFVHTNHDEVVEKNAVPEREPRFYTISRDEWAYTESTYNAAAKVSAMFASEPQVEVSVSNRNDSLGISVLYSVIERADGSVDKPNIPFKKVKESTPTSITGEVKANGKLYSRENIEVNVFKSQEIEQSFDSKFRPVPGGCQAEDPAHEPFTLGTPATSLEDNSQCWVTAAHVTDRTTGENIHQPNNPYFSSNKIGETRQVTQEGNGDVATIVSTGPDNAYNIANDDGTYGWQIAGVLGRDKLKDMNSNGESLYVQGRTTGRNQGQVLNVDTNGTEWVYIDVDTDTGDSGSPYFHVTPDNYALIAGIHRGSVDIDNDGNFDETKGNIMAWAEDVLNVVV